MATYQYPNLTVIEEDDAVTMKIEQLRQTIIARSLTPDTTYVNRGSIQAAVESQYQISIDLEDILQFGQDFLLQVRSFTGYTRMLATGYISIFPIALNLMPWNAEHGSTKVPAYTQPTELFSFDYNKPPANQ